MQKIQKIISKNKLLCIILCFFLCLSIIYGTIKNNHILKGKTKNGETIIYSIEDTDVTANDFYISLQNSASYSSVVNNMIQKTIVNDCIKTTSALKNKAQSNLKTLENNYSSNYDNVGEELNNQALALGYDSIDDYLITNAKCTELAAQYAADHFDELQIKAIRYVLVSFENSMEQSETITESEQEKMDKIDNALINGQIFSDVAKSYSDDSSTASNGGFLGVIDNNSKSVLDSTFYQTAIDLSEDETSDWIKIDNYGYFKIYCEASTSETLEDMNISEPYQSLVENYDSSLIGKALWSKMNELHIDFHDNEYLKDSFKSFCGIGEE